MSKQSGLHPRPLVPLLSEIPGGVLPARNVTFPSTDGLRLEGRLHLPSGPPRGIALLCHAPVPADGLMPNVLMPSLTRTLDAAGWAALRFNYRGIGRSDPGPASELAELDDVRGAIAYARAALPIEATAVIGWSSGATIALWACAGDAGIDRFIALSPPVSAKGPGIPALPQPTMFADWATPTLLIGGANDPTCESSHLSELAGTLKADIEIVDGADHAFNGRLDQLGALVTWFLR